jgi:3-dehydroquinate dehydratase
MKKIFAHFVIGMITRDYEKTTKIVNEIYNPKPSVDWVDIDDVDIYESIFDDVEVVSKPKSKKDEVIESIHYLRNKPNPTKQDKESIYTLEMVLRNMR